MQGVHHVVQQSIRITFPRGPSGRTIFPSVVVRVKSNVFDFRAERHFYPLSPRPLLGGACARPLILGGQRFDAEEGDFFGGLYALGSMRQRDRTSVPPSIVVDDDFRRRPLSSHRQIHLSWSFPCVAAPWRTRSRSHSSSAGASNAPRGSRRTVATRPDPSPGTPSPWGTSPHSCSGTDRRPLADRNPWHPGGSLSDCGPAPRVQGLRFFHGPGTAGAPPGSSFLAPEDGGRQRL
jgi:hypothetical protein